MLRLTRKNRTRVSNRLAIVAAALLVTAVAFGLGAPDGSLMSGKPELVDVQAAGSQAVPATTASSMRVKKKFKVSLLLLPRG